MRSLSPSSNPLAATNCSWCQEVGYGIKVHSPNWRKVSSLFRKHSWSNCSRVAGIRRRCLLGNSEDVKEDCRSDEISFLQRQGPYIGHKRFSRVQASMLLILHWRRCHDMVLSGLSERPHNYRNCSASQSIIKRRQHAQTHLHVI